MMDFSAAEILVAVVVLVAGPGGATYATNRVVMNGTRKTMERIERKLDAFTEKVHEHHARISVLEAKDD